MTSPTPAVAVPAVTTRLPFTVFPTASQAMRWAQRRTASASNAGLAWDPQRHVLGRLGFGLRRGEEIARFNPDDWFAQQTAPSIASAPYGGVAGLTDAMPTLTMDGLSTRDWVTANTSGTMSGAAMVQLNRGTAVLQAFSPNQLFEVLVDVFANHLNVVNLTEGNDFSRPTTDRVVIRGNVFGRFADMLMASSRDAGMLFYLNNDLSCGKKMNENYGREILELHTVGVSTGYTQDDVVNSARILTGRGRKGPMYQYDPDQHWVGPATVMGFSDPNSSGRGGEQVGDRYVDYLAHHPATATNLAQKLCMRMVSETPSSALVSAVAQAYLANDTQILPMVSTILRSSEFWASRGAKVRRPLENVMALLRALGAGPSSDLFKTGTAISSLLTHTGQQTFGCKTPNGYSQRGTDWLCAGAWVDLWAAQRSVIQGDVGTALPFDARAFVASAARSTVAETWNVLGQAVIGTALQPGQVAALAAHFGDTPGTRYDSSGMQGRPIEAVMMLVRVPQFTVC